MLYGALLVSDFIDLLRRLINYCIIIIINYTG